MYDCFRELNHYSIVSFQETIECLKLIELLESKGDFKAPEVKVKSFEIIMSDIDRELKRLKWTTAQAREHIMIEYGKQSRQLLTDAQLLDFLTFLENQL